MLHIAPLQRSTCCSGQMLHGLVAERCCCCCYCYDIIIAPSHHRYRGYTCRRLIFLLLLLPPLLLLPLLQGKRPSQYGQPLQQLESWARSRWPAAGERLYAWSYQVKSV
jgi:hypothetical protein